MRALPIASVLAVIVAIAGSASAVSIVNGNFSSGLTGWDVFGQVSASAGVAVLAEDDQVMLASIEQVFAVPDLALSLSFDYTLTATPGGPAGSLLPDALAVYLLDPVTFLPILSTPTYSDFFYHDSNALIEYNPAIVTIDAEIVSLDLTSVAPGTNALLAFDLTGGPNEFETVVTIDNVRISVIPEPLTATAGLLAIAALTTYIRRRRTT